jgi:hypothetical protein
MHHASRPPPPALISKRQLYGGYGAIKGKEKRGRGERGKVRKKRRERGEEKSEPAASGYESQIPPVCKNNRYSG